MPELPEVETIARDLRGQLIGHWLRGVETSGKKLRCELRVDHLRSLIGTQITRVLRRGKYLVIELTHAAYDAGAAGAADDAKNPRQGALVGHLGMSGRLNVVAPGVPLLAHTHMRLALEGRAGACELRYSDPRRFGLWRYYPASELGAAPELATLGPDPLGPSFEPVDLHRRLKQTSRALKPALLDQTLVAGLGNIYVCEALFVARISPFVRANRVTRAQSVRLHAAVVEVLSQAVANRGTSFSDYVDADGNPGRNQFALSVFQREGEPCFVCQTPVQRRVQGGRSTFYCSVCQHR